MVAAAALLAFTLIPPLGVDAVDVTTRFGPPWISVEYPSNPHHSSTRDATFLVHAYHHSTSITVPISATVEGLVDGRRTSEPVDVTPTNLPGVYAVRVPERKKGIWLVAVSLDPGEGSTATALVTLGGDGEVMTARVPSRTTPDGWVVPSAVTSGDIDAALRTAQRFAGAGEETGTSTRNAGVAGLLLLAMAGLARRRGTDR